ncbi:hypothetical protein ACFSFY_02520 [Sporosarcina siberiensis]|uniref:Uncharacterized protein n=1 Tax=Sporosarcina siberiensis TaxID=1365606 RepID=A0ABW4SDN9_9BACL
MTKTAELNTAELIEVIETIEYEEPGHGAVLYAAQFMAGFTFHTAMPIVKQIMNAVVHDKKERRCAYCEYYYRDITKNNSSVVCSPECRNLRKAKYTRTKNAAKPKKPKKLTNREKYYNDHLEYPFWTDDYEMMKMSWKHEPSYSVDKVEYIRAAKMREIEMGGKKRVAEVIDYNGDEKGVEDIRVRFLPSDKKERPATITTMSAADSVVYYEAKYSDKHMQDERRRSVIYWGEIWGKHQYMR